MDLALSADMLGQVWLVMSTLLLLPSPHMLLVQSLDLADLDPANYGLNCGQLEFIGVGVSCLLDYEPADAIIDCQVQCQVADDLMKCLNQVSVGDDCLTSLSSALMDLPAKLKEALFESDIARTCDIAFDGIIDLCPDVMSLELGDWSEWGDFGACEGKCDDGTKSRQRECNNTISFRPPEVLSPSECSGSQKEEVTCPLNACTGTSTGNTLTGRELATTILGIFLLKLLLAQT